MLSGDGLEQLLLAAAGDARDAEDLAGVGGEGHVVELDDAVDTAHGEVFDLDARLGVDGVGPVDIERHGMTDHHVRHFLRVGLTGEHVAHELTVAQHG